MSGYKKGGFNLVVDDGVEAGEGVIDGVVELTLLVRVVLVVLVADFVDAKENVEQTHGRWLWPEI